MRYGQLVIGPAGSGKSTYCATVVKFYADAGKTINVVNLDPAAEQFDYQPIIDVRELIHVDDVMEDKDLRFGPNGGLIFCLEYLVRNMDWLDEKLGQEENDYILFDCPGQIELYTHLDIMQTIIKHLQQKEFNICGVYLIDSKFMIDSAMFMSGVMTALSAMIILEVPHINVLSKMDLLSKRARKSIDRFLEPDIKMLLVEESSSSHVRRWKKKYSRLNTAIAGLIDDYSLVKFMPLNSDDHESISDLLLLINNAIQYGEDLDVQVKYPDAIDDDD